MFSRRHKSQHHVDGRRRKQDTLSSALGDLGLIASPRSARSAGPRFRPESSATDAPFHLEGMHLTSRANLIYAPLTTMRRDSFLQHPPSSSFSVLLFPPPDNDCFPLSILFSRVANFDLLQAIPLATQPHAVPLLSTEGGLQVLPAPLPLHLEE